MSIRISLFLAFGFFACSPKEQCAAIPLGASRASLSDTGEDAPWFGSGALTGEKVFEECADAMAADGRRADAPEWCARVEAVKVKVSGECPTAGLDGVGAPTCYAHLVDDKVVATSFHCTN